MCVCLESAEAGLVVMLRSSIISLRPKGMHIWRHLNFFFRYQKCVIPQHLGSCEEKGRFCVLFQLSFRTLAKCFMSTSSSLSQLPASPILGCIILVSFPLAIVACVCVCVCVCVCSFVPMRSSCHSYCSLISLPLTRLCMMFELRSPCLRQQSPTFWHQGLVLWKIISP